MGKDKKHRFWKIVSWTLGILILLIMMLPFALYIPWVQNKAKDIACSYVKKKTGMDLSVGKILIKFPLDLSLDDVTLLDQNGDTMIVAKNFTADVAVKPLFDKRFEIDGAKLSDGKYRMVSEDSSLVLRADVHHCKFTGADIDLENNNINVLDGELTGGKVHLSMFPYKKIDEPDSTKSDPWRINAKHLVLNDVDYTMEMRPTIDKMTTHLARAELKDGYVDTGLHTVDAKYLGVDSLDCKYTYASETDAAKYNREHPLPPEVFDPWADTIPWTVKGDSVRLTGGHAIYAKTGAKPAKGFDNDYIEVSDVDFEVKDFYNRGSIVKVPLHKLKARERGGLEIKDAHGTAMVNSQNIQVEDFKVKTRNSSIALDGKMDMSTFGDDNIGSMNVTTDATLDLNELCNAVPAIKDATDFIPRNKPVKVKGTFEGNTRDLSIKNGDIDIPGSMKAKVSGNIKNVTNTKKMQADVNFDADITNADFAKKEFLSKDVQKQVNIPPMKAKGKVSYNPGAVAGDIDMRLKQGGTLTGKGTYNLKNQSYTVDATAKALPVNKIVPQLDVKNVSAHIKAKGHGFDFLEKNTAVDAQVKLDHIDYAGKQYRNLDADIKLNGNNFDAKVNARNRGTLAANGSFDRKTEKYDIDATLNSFPVDEFVPSLGVGDLTAKVQARGKNFDFLNRNTWVDAKVDLTRVEYNHQVYRDLKGNVSLDGNHFDGHITSTNPDCDVDADLNGTIDGDHYYIDLKGNVRDLDLKALKLTDMPCDGSGYIDLKGDFNLKTKTYNANVTLTDLDWNIDGEKIFSDQTDLRFNSDNNSISAYYNDESTYINFSAPHSINDFMDRLDKCSDIAKRQYKKLDVDVNEVCDALPRFDMDLNMGPNGIIQRMLGKWDIDFRNLQADLHNDSTLHGHFYGHTLSKGNNAIDTLAVNIIETGRKIGFSGHMGNQKGTWDEMANVDIAGYATGSQINMMFNQRNIKHETGYHVGLNANIQDSILDVNIMPRQPVIAYRQWNINDSNYVRMDLGDKRLEANLKLESDSSLITLRTDPVQQAGKQNIIVDIDNLRIEEWTNMIPSLTAMSGTLDAEMQLSYDGHNLEGDGDISLSNFTYNGMKQGNLKMTTDLTIDPSTSATHLNANLNIDGSDVALAYGSLNDETADNPLNLNVKLNRFPLRKVSMFIPGRRVWLNGYANGEMTVSGTMDNPVMNGHLVGDSAFVNLPRYGSSLRLSEERIDVNGNTINFHNYKIYGLNNKAALLNGDVDFRSLENIKMDLNVTGRDIQFFGSEQKSYSEIFGKGFIDIDGTLKSSNNLTAINANAKLLPGSDITYVMQDEITTLSKNSATEGMVTFINPNDTNVWYNDSIIIGAAAAGSALNMVVNVDVEKGAKINAFLQPEGKDRANIDGSGKLRYSLDFAGKDNLNGTYVINSGTVRYTPPVISQKVFNIVDGSSLTWNGDMLNPQLNLRGTSGVRTSVANENGNGSRLVDFDIEAILKNTLSNIDLKFDLDAKNDAAVQSELQTLTDTQRSQAAINLLLYNSYSGANTTGEFSTSGALFSFLQSQINSWAANNLKGIDVSFGINQYQGANNGGKLQTSYSYRLSKTLFNDRFKIAVGGEYSTEATSEANFSENLINDISFEYLLNPSGTRYLRLFRHKGIESVLEGEITITGISFVMKHKISSIGDLFRWLKKKPKVELPKNLNNTNIVNDTTNTQAP